MLLNCNVKKIMRSLITFLLVSFIFIINPLTIENVHASTVTRLKDLPKNTIVYDDSWNITYYSDQNNTVRKTGVVDWKVAAKNYYGKDEVTLLSNEYWNIGVMLGGSSSSYSISKAKNQYNNAGGNKELFDKNIIQVVGDIRTNSGSYIHVYGTTLLDRLYYISLSENDSWQVFPSVSNGGMWTRINGNWSSGSGPSSWYRYSSATSASDIDSGYTGGGVPLTNLHGNTGVELQAGGKYKLLLNREPEVILNTPVNETNLNGSHINITGTVKDLNTYDTLNLYYTVSTFEFGKEEFLKPVTGQTDILFQIISANGTDQAFTGLIANNPVFPKGPLAISVYAKDDVGGKSNVATVYVANNNSTRYFYDKFNVIPTITAWTNANWDMANDFRYGNFNDPNNYLRYWNGTAYVTTNNPEFYPSYTYNKLTGSYDLTGTKLTAFLASGTPMYTKITKGNEKILLRVTRTMVNVYDDEEGWYTYPQMTYAELPPSSAKGTLHTANVAAQEYSLPNDGIHWDGFWYVKKGLANFLPVITVNTPSTVKYFGNGQDISIGGTIQDGDNDTVTISATINGVNKSTTVSNTLAAKPWTLTWSSSEVPQGVYSNIALNANDGFGGTASATHTGNIIVDKTNPNAPTITVNENWTNAANVAVTITPGTDAGGSGVNRTEYSLSGATTLGWTTYSAAFNIANAGETSISARTIDSAGNISNVSSKTVRVDRVNPTGTISGNVTDWTNGDITLIITTNDEGGSNVRRIRLPDNSQVDGASTTYRVTSNGAYSFVVEDNAGNQTTVTEVVDKIDKLSPVVDADNKAYDWTNGDITITLSYQDYGGSGLDITQYKITDTFDEPLDGWVDYNHTIVINSDGSFYLHYRATDTAGNVTKGYFGPYQRDTIEPSIIVNFSNDHTNQDIDISLEFNGNGSSIVAQKWGMGNLSIYDIRNIGIDITSNLITVSENGYYTFYARDEAGNEAIELISINAIDKIPPTVFANNLDFDWKNNDIVVELDYQDEGGSELAVSQYQVTMDSNIPLSWDDYTGEIVINADGEHYIHYRALDYSGNETVGYFGPYSLDKENPTAPTILRNPDADHNREGYEISFAEGVDNISGIKDIFYRLSGASEQDWTLYSGDVISVEAQGEIIIEALNTDLAGNESTIAFIRVIIYGEAYDDAVEALDQAGDLVGTARDSLQQSDVDDAREVLDEARNLINLLPESDDKTQLTERLIDLESELEIIQTIIDILDALERIEDGLEHGEESPNNVDMIQDLINETQNKIDTLPDGDPKEDLQSQLDELKERHEELKERVNIITTLTMKLDNADLDFSVYPTLLVIDTLDSPQHYNILITDLEINTVIVDTTATGDIGVPDTYMGHLYKVELEAYHDGELIAQRTFERVNPDTIKPVIEYAYMLDGVLNIFATDNYKLHNTPYAFRIINNGESVDMIENTVVDTQFGVIAWTVNNEGVTSIDFQVSNSFSVSHPRTVMARVRDTFGNINNVTLNVTKANEALFGDIPQHIIDSINQANNPPSGGGDDRESSTTTPVNTGNTDVVIVDKNLSEEAIKEITATLENDNLKVDPIATDLNSQEGAISIDIKRDLNKLNELIKSQLGDSSDTYYRITVTEKSTNRLVYTKVSANPETLLIPNLKDSTLYIIRISVVSGGKDLAFREIERMTYDRTPPVIERIIVKNNVLEIVASDNIALHTKAFKYALSSTGRIAKLDLAGLLASANEVGYTVDFLVSNFGTNVWTEKSRLSGLETGTKVRVIVRDHAENYVVNEFEVVEGMEMDSINSKNPMDAHIDSEYDSEDLMKRILEEYNKNNPANPYDLNNFDPASFTIRSSNPNIAYFENGKLKFISPGSVIITLTDKTTGRSYAYSILVNKYKAFDRRIIVQIDSETDLARVFEEQLYKEFKNTPIYFMIEDGSQYGSIYESIFKAGHSEGIVTIKATDGYRALSLYIVVVKNEYPESEVAVIFTKLAYVIKVGDNFNMKAISAFYNEMYQETDTKYLVLEVNNEVLGIDNNLIYAVNAGIGTIRIIDLAKNRVEEIEVKVIDLSRSNDNYQDIHSHWAKDTIVSLAGMGIVEEGVQFKPNEEVSIGDFLIMYSRTKAYNRNFINERRNMLPSSTLERLALETSYYIQDALNHFTAFEIEHVFGKNLDVSRKITREEVATFLALSLKLENGQASGSFKDTAHSSRKAEIEKVKEHGLMVGYGAEYFRPMNFLTRAEMAKVIHNIFTNNLEEKMIN